MTLRAVSYGGGVQSTALLVLAAQRRIDFPVFLMANVGDDSEHPDTLDYVRNVAAPYAEEHGIELALLDRRRRDGSVETLMDRITDSPRSLPIPVRMPNGAPGNRSCTADFKIRVIAKELKRRGATADDPAVVAIGISLDEIHRANTRHSEPYERLVYPLVGIGEHSGLALRRNDCERVIRDAGLPVPPKSSCYFCPFHRPEVWADMRRNEPELFDKAADVEALLNERSRALGRPPVWLTRFNMPLRDAIHQDLPLFDVSTDDSGCDSGWCFT